MGTVNCSLFDNSGRFTLIDTAPPNQEAAQTKELNAAGSQTGDLILIIPTQGDIDHTGNVVYLRTYSRTTAGMHGYDFGKAGYGDTSRNWENCSLPMSSVTHLVPVFTGFGSSNRFRPKIVLRDGDNLIHHGLNAEVYLPGGHSNGSTTIVTSHGNLCTSDLIDQTKMPSLGKIMDDVDAGISSFVRSQALEIRTVSLKEGVPFTLEQLEVERM